MNNKTELIGGVVGDALKSSTDLLSEIILKGFFTLLDIVLDCGYWVCSCGLIVCLLIFTCTKDTKATMNGFKFGFVLLVITFIRSAMS